MEGSRWAERAAGAVSKHAPPPSIDRIERRPCGHQRGCHACPPAEGGTSMPAVLVAIRAPFRKSPGSVPFPRSDAKMLVVEDKLVWFRISDRRNGVWPVPLRKSENGLTVYGSGFAVYGVRSRGSDLRQPLAPTDETVITSYHSENLRLGFWI